MRRNYYINLFIFFYCFIAFAQSNKINIDAELTIDTKQIEIKQEIVYYNTSKNPLDTIYLHNWSNAYKDRSTPLSKQLIENYKKSLYFAKLDKRGFSKINSLSLNGKQTIWDEVDNAEDIIKITLNESLIPGDSAVLEAEYLVKIPVDKFTDYGYNLNNFNLRYWYLIPAVYDGKWHTMSNLDLDDVYMNPSDYQLNFKIPLGYTLHSDLEEEANIMSDHVLYTLSGENRVDIEINIQLQNNFSLYQTDSMTIISNLKSVNLTEM